MLLLLPGTYMNESGRAVGEACQFYKLPPEATTVFHDEIELPPGKVRVKVGGGIAGHNGLRSIDATLGPLAKGGLRLLTTWPCIVEAAIVARASTHLAHPK